jgi:phosphoenolpyruvate carboxykinase (ATP)
VQVVALAPARGRHGLENHGITNTRDVHWNLSTLRLYEGSIRRRESRLAHPGLLVVRTGQDTGRSPNDKFVVRESSSEEKVWRGKVNRPIVAEQFEVLRRMFAYLRGRDLFVQGCSAGDDPADFVPQFAVIQAPGYYAIPEIDGTRSAVFVALNFGERTVGATAASSFSSCDAEAERLAAMFVENFATLPSRPP